MADEGQGQIPHVHFLSWLTHTAVSRVSSTVLCRQGAGHASLSAAAGKGEAPALLLAVDGRGKWGGPLSLALTTKPRWGAVPALVPSGLAHLYPCLWGLL